MAQVRVTAHIRRHTACTDLRTTGTSVAQALAAYFQRFPRARGYVLDDQGAVRHHVVVFVDGRPLRDRARLSDPVTEDSEIHVFQALSGG